MKFELTQAIVALSALCLCLLATTASAGSDPFVGVFEASGIPGYSMTLKSDGDGRYSGYISTGAVRVPLEAERNGNELRGILTTDAAYGFSARVRSDGELVMLDDSGASVSFTRRGGTGSQAAPAPTPRGSNQGAPSAVFVNGRALLAQDLQALSAARIQIHPGRYWYDSVCGAWGVEGGPTLGFIVAGLPAAPLQAQASRGRTGVFVNGRQLPAQDLQAIQALTGVLQPGRYFVDGMGNAGFEGGPILINLVAAAQTLGGGAGGGGNGWSSPITGATGNHDGNSGYVILRSPTGGSTTVGY